MTIRFWLSYYTIHGEALVLNLLSPDGDKVEARYRMATTDGTNWTTKIECDRPAHYYYSVEKNGADHRHEWLLEPHRLNVAGGTAEKLTVYDNWIDIPKDASLYSSAFTDCFARRGRTTAVGRPYTDGGKAAQKVFLKVRAPQLRQGERLVVLGSHPLLGSWKPLEAVCMTEQAPNEWIVSLDGATLGGSTIEFKFVALGDHAAGRAPHEEPLRGSAAGAGSSGEEPLRGSGDGSEIATSSLQWEEGFNRRLDLPVLEAGESILYEMQAASFPIYPFKAAGTVVPIFSLRSEGSFGVGDFGDLKAMTEWMAQTGQRVLQILPIYDTTITHTWQDSYPYNSISIYALHPQYVDLRQLPPLADEARMAYYEEQRRELNALPQIDYERVNATKRAYLRELFDQIFPAVARRKTFKKFFADNDDWLVPYAAFCHYRDLYGTATFSEWPDHHSLPEAEREAMAKPGTKAYRSVAFWYFVQYVLDTQLSEAHDHARRLRVVLKGDIPIGISRDGVEAWVEPKYFNLNGQAGAPPDAFSTNGQNWGFPTYNWDAMLEDGCSWWVRRFRKMAEFFDAYRIDHVLGFFRIWEIPIHAVHGLLGQFSPALPMTREEIESYGLRFDEDRFTQPFITDWTLDRMFGPKAQMIKDVYLDRIDGERYKMKPIFDTQRKVEQAFKNTNDEEQLALRDALYAMISCVLFVRDHKDPSRFHPRIAVQLDFIYESLWDSDKQSFNRLYNDYFYRRNSQFWYQEAMKKLPLLTQATRMLVCAEDLGMVPECVPWVMEELRILSLEIQSMPKDSRFRFGHLSHNPYRSVCTISTHDMPTLRQWWDEDEEQTRDYFSSMLHRSGTVPHPLPGWLAEDIVMRNLMSPSMLCLLSLQDWLSIDEGLRLADAGAERINIPSNPRHYWRYRMHLSIEQLKASEEFNQNIQTLIKQSGRKC